MCSQKSPCGIKGVLSNINNYLFPSNFESLRFLTTVFLSQWKSRLPNTNCINNGQKYSFLFMLIRLISTDQMQKKCSFRTRLVGLKHEDKRIFFWPPFMQSDYVRVVDCVVSKNKLSSIQGSNFRKGNLCFICKWALYMLFFTFNDVSWLCIWSSFA